MDYGILNVCTDINARDCTRGFTDTVEESLHWKLTPGEKFLAAPGNRTCVGSVPVRCSANWATSPLVTRNWHSHKPLTWNSPGSNSHDTIHLTATFFWSVIIQRVQIFVVFFGVFFYLVLSRLAPRLRNEHIPPNTVIDKWTLKMNYAFHPIFRPIFSELSAKRQLP